MTIPTIAELKGNTVLELIENGYNALKNGMNNKQDTLVAGDNIVISGNVISAIEGGTPVLENYYTKQETDSLLGDKADSSDVYDKEQIDDMLVAIGSEIPDMEYYYTKSEVDTLVAANGYKIINTVTPTVMSNPNAIKIEGLQNGDIVELCFKDRQKPAGTAEFTESDVHLMFVYKTNMNEVVGTYSGFNPTIVGSAFTGSWCIVSVEAEATVVGNYLRIILSGTRGTISNGAFANEYTNCDGIVMTAYTIIRRA